MRKIDQQVAIAIEKKENMNQGNTLVQYSLTKEESSVSLHGSEIAKVFHEDNIVVVNFCGFQTNVTRDRINAVLNGAGKIEHFKFKNGEIVLMPTNVVVRDNETIKL